MRRLAAALICAALLLARQLASADENYSLGLGRTIPLKDEGFNAVAGPGFGLSLEYYHQFSWVFGLGVDADELPFASKTNNAGSLTETGTYKAYEVAGIARVSPFYGDSPIEPFAVVGIGFNSFSGKLQAQPNAGFAWPNTGTAEQRTLYDATSLGAVYVLGGGFDYIIPNKDMTVGLDVRWHFLAISESNFDSQWAKTATIMLRFGLRLPD